MSVDRERVVGVVLHFRTVERTIACLKSLGGEGIPRIVLVDNSEDHGASLSVMRPELEQLRLAGMNVDVLVPKVNLGFAKGVNAGLAYGLRIGAEAFFLINSDATIETGALTPLLRGIDEAGVSIPLVRSRRGAPAGRLFGFYHAATALLARSARSGCMQYPSGCCLLLRADVARPPLLDEDFFFYGEDVVLGRDLRARGVNVVECPDATIVHEGTGSAKNGSMFYEYHMARGHWLLAGKLAPNPLKHLGYVACRCVILPMRALVRSVRFRSLIPWRGLMAATADVISARCRSFTPPVA